VLGSPDGGTFGTKGGSKAQTFDPASGNTLTIPPTNSSARYVRVAFTGNTGRPVRSLRVRGVRLVKPTSSAPGEEWTPPLPGVRS
jgi:hypothetical protein